MPVPRKPIVAPLLTTVAKRFVTPKSAANLVSGMSPSVVGGVGAMLHTEDAVAPVLDVTRTSDYQRVSGMVNAGRGDNTDISNWNPSTSWLPPSYANSLENYNAQQKQMDDLIVRQGGIRPSDERMLQNMNQFNLRAKARRFAPGAAY